jgi:hypothetical protein
VWRVSWDLPGPGPPFHRGMKSRSVPAEFSPSARQTSLIYVSLVAPTAHVSRIKLMSRENAARTSSL